MSKRELVKVPDYSNTATVLAFRRLGPFPESKILEFVNFNFQDLAERGPIEFTNGDVYVG
jgi:hypothetical protein